MQILVLGMHRSGTSAVTRIINMMGAYLGPEERIASSGFDNPKGFWEHSEVSRLDTRTLAAMGAAWDAIDSFDLKDLPEKAAEEFEKTAKQIVCDLDAHRPWAVKDPRLCLLLPLWRPFLEAPVCVHVYRSPLEVARSLNKRNGFCLNLGVALWEAYNRSALAASCGLPRLIVRFGDLMERRLETVQQLFEDLRALGVQGLSMPSQTEIQGFLDQDLYHEREDTARRKAILNVNQLELARGFEDGSILGLEEIGPLSMGGEDMLKEHRVVKAYRALAELAEESRQAVSELRQIVPLERSAQQAARNAQDAQIRRLKDELNGIHRSRLWRLADRYWRLLRALQPGRRTRQEPRRLPVVEATPSGPRNAAGVARAPAAAAASGTGYDVFCFPIIDWEFRFQRPQQLSSQFAQHGHRVFYLRTDFHQSGPLALLEPIQDHVYGLQLPGPAELNLYHDTLDEATVEATVEALGSLRRQSGVEQAICLVQLPFWARLAFELRREWGWKVVYDCMDEHSGFSANKAIMLESEQELVANSDLVTATSHALYARISPVARRTILSPNAADFDHFHQPRTGRLLTDIAKPIIGYYGEISEWFDVEMVHRAASARPAWQFVLIGETHGADVSALQELHNVHFLGEQPYALLPGYLQAFDVATIPFKISPLTQATDPVKRYEYSSAGVPVVASALPDLEHSPDHLYLVHSKSEFLPQLEAALAEGSDLKRGARIEFARQNTWSARFDRLHEAIRDAFGKAAIIVVSHKNLKYLQLCLQSLEQKTLYPNFEVVVVDNASGSDVTDYLLREQERKPWLKVVLNEENLGFPHANNIGLRSVGDCEYVVFLNDDVVVTRGWLSRLIRCLEDQDAAMVGPVTNWAGNEACIEVDYDILEEMDAFADDYMWQHDGEFFEIKTLALYCVVMRRTLIDQVGFLDERFGIGMFEDDDLAERVRRAGGRLLCTDGVFVHHWGRSSFGALDQETYDRLFEENRRKFEDKWGKPWVAHRRRS